MNFGYVGKGVILFLTLVGVLTFGDKTEKLQWVWGFGKARKDQIGFFDPLDLCGVYFRLIMNQGQNRYFEDVFIWGKRDTHQLPNQSIL